MTTTDSKPRRRLALAGAAMAVSLAAASAALLRSDILKWYYSSCLESDHTLCRAWLRSVDPIRREVLVQFLSSDEGEGPLRELAQEFLAAMPEEDSALTFTFESPLGFKISCGVLANVSGRIVRAFEDGDDGGQLGRGAFEVGRAEAEVFSDALEFLGLLRGCMGRRFQLPGHPDVVVVVVPAHEAMACYGHKPEAVAGTSSSPFRVCFSSVGRTFPQDLLFTEFSDNLRLAIGEEPALLYFRHGMIQMPEEDRRLEFSGSPQRSPDLHPIYTVPDSEADDIDGLWDGLYSPLRSR